MQRPKNLFKLLAFLIITCVAGAANAQSADDVIAKHIKAMGGEKLGKLQSMKISAEMDIMNMKVPITTTIVQNKGFRSETTVQGSTIVQAVSGTTGWAINPMTGNSKATALPADAVKSLTNETDLTGLYNYKEKGYKVTLDGEEDLAGAKVYKVTMILPDGVRRINYISKDTFYILKIVAQTSVNGQEIMSENVQSDFRSVDGIYYPFTSEVTTSAMPGTKMGLKILAIEMNPKVDPKIFEMPQ